MGFDSRSFHTYDLIIGNLVADIKRTAVSLVGCKCHYTCNLMTHWKYYIHYYSCGARNVDMATLLRYDPIGSGSHLIGKPRDTVGSMKF